MTKKIICESSLKENIILEYSFPFFLISIDGIHEVVGSVKSVSSAFAIGENYIATSISKRNILIKGAIKNDNDLIKNRNKLYRIFPLKSFGTLYYYEGDIKRKINYVVESINITEKGMHRQFQISLICPYPYFTDANKTVLQMATWIPSFEFPFEIPEDEGIEFGLKNKTSMAIINNTTNLEFGMIITFKANDTVVNPSLFNVDSREEIKIEKTMQAGDKIVITTYRQDKNIIYISESNKREENINNLMTYGSKFLQVHIGKNTFRYNAEANIDNLEATIEYLTEYEAV